MVLHSHQENGLGGSENNTQLVQLIIQENSIEYLVMSSMYSIVVIVLASAFFVVVQVVYPKYGLF